MTGWKKKMAAYLSLVMLAGAVCACGSVPGDRDWISTEEEETTIGLDGTDETAETLAAETVVIEETTEEAVEATEETLSETETPTETVTQEEIPEEPEWVTGYRDFLSDHSNFLPLLEEENEGGMTGFINGFCLYDMDKNGIPELLVQKCETATYLYTWTETGVEMRWNYPYDSFGTYVLGYDSRDGAVYEFCPDAGTGGDRLTALNVLTLPEQPFDRQRAIDSGNYWTNGTCLYSALYGDFEGTNVSLSWEEAQTSESSKITKEQFQEILANFKPFLFHQITEENIEQYIRGNYQVQNQDAEMSLDQFASAMGVEGRWQDRPSFYAKSLDEFRNRRIRVEVNEQNSWPDNLIEEEDWAAGRCYIDLDTLACYREEQVEILYTSQEAWKESYYKLLSELKRNGSLSIEDGYFVGEIYYDENNLRFQFVKWEGQEFPLLYISNAYTTAENYFMIQHGEPVFLCSDVMNSLGSNYSETRFIEGTNFFWIFNRFAEYSDELDLSWNLYEISESGERQTVASLDLTIPPDYSEQFEIQGFPEGIPLLPEDFVEASLRGETVSYDVFVGNLQTLFGADGAKQILNLSENGPLSIVSAPEIEGGYSMNEMDAVFFG